MRLEAQAPVIISASRATDIPAYFADRFIDSIKTGYLRWKNPFNGKISYVSFDKTRLIVFWTKNPAPLIQHLDFLKEKGINYYFQFTLNDYEKEKLEPHIPPLEQRIDTFIRLAEREGKEKVVWRFDPYLLTSGTGVDELLRKTEYTGNRLAEYTDTFVFSFADINAYRRVQNNIKRSGIAITEPDEKQMNELAEGIANLNRKWKYNIFTCAEKINLEKYGIHHGKCIDDDKIVRLFSQDKELMDYIGYNVSISDNQLYNRTNRQGPVYRFKVRKDKGQRKYCGCIPSKDIGQYNTCLAGCVYCYATYFTAKAVL